MYVVYVIIEEVDLIVLCGVKVFYCLCSNSSIISGVVCVCWLWLCGVEVGFGIDVSGGYSFSVFEVVR